LQTPLFAMSRPHRLDSSSYKGFRPFFLTIGTRARARVFTDPAVVAVVVSQLLRVATDEGFAVIAYCFMPDHVHLVVAGRSATSDLPRFVRLAKQRSGFCFKQAFGRHLWQESFYERVVRRIDDLADVIAYVIDNPVRARLADNPAAYPHWGSQVYEREEILRFVGSARRAERRV
jgi:putative transposase